MMNEITRRMVDELGLTDEQADAALAIVMGYLRENVPTPIAARLDWAMKSAAPADALRVTTTAVCCAVALGKQV